MTLLQEPHDPQHSPGELPVEPGDEQLLEQREVAGLSQGQIVRRRFFRHKGAVVSLIVLTFIVLLATTSIGFGPFDGWWKWDYNTVVPPNQDQGPTMSLRPTWLGGAGIRLGDHPFGLDNERARDMFALTMRGVQQTLVVILVLAVLAVTIGVTIGALAGYFGRWVDSVLMRFTDIIITIPLLLIAAVASYAFKFSGIWSVALALGLFTWTGLARLVRAEFLALREREFVDAARVAGASNFRIIFKHILPNTVGTIVVATTLLMGAGILTEDDLPAAEIELLGPTGSARIDTLVRDIVHTSRAVGDIAQSEEIGGAMLRLRKFMFDRVYLGPEARSEHERVQRTLRTLFDHYVANPDEIPEGAGRGDEVQRATDYIAGMTDRFCIATFRRLALPEQSRL